MFQEYQMLSWNALLQKMWPFYHFFQLVPQHMTPGCVSKTASNVTVSRLLHLWPSKPGLSWSVFDVSHPEIHISLEKSDITSQDPRKLVLRSGLKDITILQSDTYWREWSQEPDKKCSSWFWLGWWWWCNHPKQIMFSTQTTASKKWAFFLRIRSESWNLTV